MSTKPRRPHYCQMVVVWPTCIAPLDGGRLPCRNRAKHFVRLSKADGSAEEDRWVCGDHANAALMLRQDIIVSVPPEAPTKDKP